MSTILVVDDMAICREPIAEALQRRGYDVLCASDGNEALSILHQQHPDLVLLDVNMPQLDGLCVLRSMRQDPDLKQIPVVLLTDRTERACIKQAAGYGANGYLLKSQFSLDRLLASVGACLGQLTTSAAAPRPTDKTPPYIQRRTKAEQTTRVPTAAAPPRVASPAKNRAAPQSAPDASRESPQKPTPESLDNLAPVITREELIRLVNKGLELRPLGPAVQNVIAVTGSAGCSADDVAKAVTHDQALSIRILKLANSTSYSRGHPVDSVKEAVQRIGVHEVRSMVMTLGVFQQYEGGAGEHVDPRLFWGHSIACGLVASAIARARRAGRVDDCFLWGLTHDVGRLILLDHVPNAYSRVWEAADRLTLPLEAIETRMMFLDHCAILERALEHWQFPREFIAPVVNHHRSHRGIKQLGPQHCEAATIVALANRIAHALLLGSSGNDVIYPLDTLVGALQLKPPLIAQITEAIPEDTNNLKFAMLARANEESWPDFGRQVKEQLSAPLRPLCVSAEPGVDAYRMFCECLASPSDENPPNLGVIYLRNVGEFASLTTKYEAEERARGAANAPLVVICDKGRVDTDHTWLRSRRYKALAAPVRISTLVTTINDLLM